MSDQTENTGDIEITGDEFRAALAACASFKLGRKVEVGEIEGLAITDNNSNSFGFIAEDADVYEIELIMFEQDEKPVDVTAEIGPEDLIQPKTIDAPVEDFIEQQEPPTVTAEQHAEASAAGLTDAEIYKEEASTYRDPSDAEISEGTTPAVEAEVVDLEEAALLAAFGGPGFADRGPVEDAVVVFAFDDAAGVNPEVLEQASLCHTGMTTEQLVLDMSQVAEAFCGLTEAVVGGDVETDVAGPTEQQMAQILAAAAAGGDEPSEYEQHVRAEAEVAEEPPPVTMGQRVNDMQRLLDRLRGKQ